MTSTPTRRGGLGRRLLAALALVLATAGVTALLVAGAVGPAIFHEHMAGSGVRTAEEAEFHSELAFRTASARALTMRVAAGPGRPPHPPVGGPVRGDEGRERRDPAEPGSPGPGGAARAGLPDRSRPRAGARDRPQHGDRTGTPGGARRPGPDGAGGVP